MVVVDHEPYSWFLLQDERGFILDVNCQQSFVSYSCTFRLEDAEVAQIKLGGHLETDRLARLVQHNPVAYADRHDGAALGAACLAAILRWQASRPVA
jgi:hypothetical protein